MKRVLVDCHSFDYNYFQGVTTYLRGLYKESIIQSSDIQFYLASNDVEKLISIFGLHSNVTYVKLRFKNPLLRLILELPYHILKNKIDYIHVQYKGPFIKLCKEIVTIHDVLFLDFPEYFPKSFYLINRLYYKFSSKRADILLTVSNYSKSRISKQFNIQEQKILIIPNGIDETFQLLSKKNKLIANVKSKYGLDRYILYVSRIEPRKNHQLIVNAFKDLKLADKGYKLVFIGATTFENKMLNSDLKSLSSDNFVILENISTEELAGFYYHSAFSVFPSFAEGFGIPIIESTLMGRPVLFSNTTAMSDFSFIKDQMFDPNSLEELKLLINKTLEMSFENQDEKIITVKDLYTWQKISNNFLKLIK